MRGNIDRDKKLSLAQHWAESWHADQNDLIARLGIAVRDNDYDEQCICVGQLRESSAKRFRSLPDILSLLIDADKISAAHEAKRQSHKAAIDDNSKRVSKCE